MSPEPVPRGRAAEALIGAAAELLAEATLDDLTAFMTVSRLRERTGLSSGAIYSAFSPTSGVGDRTRSAPRVIARRALFEPLGSADETVRRTIALVDAALDEIEAGPGELVATEVAGLFASTGMDGARGGLAPEYDAAWLMARVSLADEEAAAHLLASYRGFQEVYTVLVRRLLAMARREPLPGITVGQLSVMFTTILDGGVFRVRFDPERGEEFLVQLVLGAWSGLTRSVGDADATLEARVAVPTDVALDADESASVRDAVRRLTDRAGWAAVTLAEVSELSGVPLVRLAARHPDRHSLAALRWSELVDGLERRASLRSGREPSSRLVELVEDVAGVACANRALTASLLREWIERTDRLEDEPAPDVRVRLRELVAAELRGAGAAPGDAATRAEVALDALLLGAATSSVSSSAAAAAVLAGLGTE